MIYLAGFIANGILYAVENRTASLTGSPFEGAGLGFGLRLPPRSFSDWMFAFL